MGGIVSLWQASRRFFGVVLLFDVLIAAVVAGAVVWFDRTLSAGAVAQGLWIACLAIGILWMISLLARNGFLSPSPANFPEFRRGLPDQEPMSADSAMELTWLALAIAATLGLAAFVLGAR